MYVCVFQLLALDVHENQFSKGILQTNRRDQILPGTSGKINLPRIKTKREEEFGKEESAFLQ